MSKLTKSFIFLIAVLVVSACATKKKKEEVGGFKKFYHNTTAKFNGYFNANVLLEESILSLEQNHQDNYNKVLPVFKYDGVDEAKSIEKDLDKAIEKVTIVAALHEVSHWKDDCYVLMGKAQYLQQDYESAEETLEYFEEAYNPKNPKKRKKSKTELKKEKENKRSEDRKAKAQEKKDREKEKEEAREQKEEDRKAREKRRADEKKAKEDLRKEEDGLKADLRKLKDKLRDATKDRKDKERKEIQKARKKKKRLPKKDPNGDYRSDKEKELEAEIAKVQNRIDAINKIQAEMLEKNQMEDKVDEEENLSDEAKKEENKEKKDDPKEEESKEDEEEEESDKKKDDVKDDNSGGKGFLKHKPAYQEGVLWLAKTYIQRERWSAAVYMLDKLANESNLLKKVRREYPAVRAQFYLAQKKYADAIEYLQVAIESQKDKKLKARYSFILGQVYQILGNQAAAYEAFEQVAKFKPGYEMEFHAQMATAKNAYASGSQDVGSTMSKLNKMLKENKNQEFKGHIYFTMAEIELQQDKLEPAIENFKKSIKFNETDDNQKTESYYTLARLFFDAEKYVMAKNYYDSTLVVMNKKDLRLKEVEGYSANLKEIAENIQIIELQDSLLRISAMSDEDKMALAVKMKEEMDAKKAAAEDSEETLTYGRNTSSLRAGMKPSSFFAYNPVVLQKGVNDFERIWGNIRLEDDWRRSNKSSNDLSLEEEVQEEEVAELNSRELKTILKDVPDNPSEISSANNKIKNALFELGTLYRDRLANYNKSAESLEELIKRYPASDKEAEALYYLYLDYLDLENMALAEKYKNQLVQTYPQSLFAQSIMDSGFTAKFAAEAKEVDDYYNETYILFNDGKHQEAKNRIDQVEKLFGNEIKLNAKFALLNAMVTGGLNGKEAYIKELKNVIGKHPNTPEQTRAKEILRFLRGDAQAFDAGKTGQQDSRFVLQDNKLHYVLVIVYSKEDTELNNAKVAVSNFNREKFRDSRLKLSTIPLNVKDGSSIILIRKFTNKELAMNYYNAATELGEDYLGIDAEFDVFAITSKNYREVIKQRTVNSYRNFFEDNYLK